MGTRATIRFRDGDEVYYIYRGHDGFPENILTDIQLAITKSKGRWSEPEFGCFVSLFISMNYQFQENRLPKYELTTSFHGDESYLYFCEWTGDKYVFGILDE